MAILRVGLMLVVLGLLGALAYVRMGCSCTSKRQMLISAVKGDLGRLGEAEWEANRLDGSYSKSLSRLAGLERNAFHADTAIRITVIEATRSGWRAVARHVGVPEVICTSWAGTVTTQPRSAALREPQERLPRCAAGTLLSEFPGTAP